MNNDIYYNITIYVRRTDTRKSKSNNYKRRIRRNTANLDTTNKRSENHQRNAEIRRERNTKSIKFLFNKCLGESRLPTD